MPGLGNKSFVQYGIQAAYGTAVAAQAKGEIISASIDPVVGMIPDPSLYSGVSRRGVYQGGLYHQGRLLMRANYGGTAGGMGRLLRAAFGAVVTTGAGPFLHTYKEAATPPALTIEIIDGDVVSGQCIRCIDSLITEMTIRGTAGQGEDAMLQFEFGFVCKTVTPAFTLTPALAYPVISPMLFHQSVTSSGTDDGSNDALALQRIRSFEMTLTNNYALDRFYFGSITPDTPLRNDFISARWRFTSEFVSYAAYNRATAFSTSSPRLKVVSGADSFELRSASAKLVEYGHPIEGYGVIVANLTHEAFQDPTDVSALVGVLTNGLAGATENGA